MDQCYAPPDTLYRVSAMLAWLATVGFGVTGLYTAIFASRAKHDRQRAPLLILELLVLGVALVSWFFLIWFLAKILIALGLGAAVALGASIAIGIVLLVPTCAAVWLIVLRSYAALGRSAQFDSDVRSLRRRRRLNPMLPWDSRSDSGWGVRCTAC